MTFSACGQVTAKAQFISRFSEANRAWSVMVLGRSSGRSCQVGVKFLLSLCCRSSRQEKEKSSQFVLLALEDELQATRWGPMREERLASSHGRSGLLVAGPELCDASVWAAYADVGSTCRHATAACRCRKSLRSSQENQTGQHWQSTPTPMRVKNAQESSKNWIFSQVHHSPVLIVVSLKKQRMPGCQPEPCGIFPGTPSINSRQASSLVSTNG